MVKKIYAIIPAREGSKGVPNKNIKYLGNHPLIAYSIAAAKLTPEVSRIIISTDSIEYADIAKKYGAEVPFLRPKEIASDKSTDLEFFNHAINWFKKNELLVPDYFLHLRPTTPLRDPKLISSAIYKILSDRSATSLRSSHLAPESPYKWFRKDHMGYFTSLEGDNNIEVANRARQEFPDVYIPDGYVDLVISSYIQTENRLHGNRVIAFEGPSCVEIDSMEEFDYLEYLILKKGSILKDYLDNLKL